MAMTPPASVTHVRQAAAVDAALLARIGAEWFAQTYAGQNTPQDLSAYLAKSFSEDLQRAELLDPHMRTWIAESNDKSPAGYVQLRFGTAPSALSLAKPAELARIYVDARGHGAGVGHRLLQQCVDAARAWGATHLWLGVWQENPRGIAFYERNGFRIAGEQTFQLGGDVQRDWIMLRDLGA